MNYFTSDLHLGHRNIIRLCNRPFATIEEMDETLIRNWNAKVTNGDTVYILGDLLFRNEKPAEEYLKQLKGSGLIVSRREGKEVYYKLADTETARLVHKVCEEMFQITCPLEQ